MNLCCRFFDAIVDEQSIYSMIFWNLLWLYLILSWKSIRLHRLRKTKQLHDIFDDLTSSLFHPEMRWANPIWRSKNGHSVQQLVPDLHLHRSKTTNCWLASITNQFQTILCNKSNDFQLLFQSSSKKIAKSVTFVIGCCAQTAAGMIRRIWIFTIDVGIVFGVVIVITVDPRRPFDQQIEKGQHFLVFVGRSEIGARRNDHLMNDNQLKNQWYFDWNETICIRWNRVIGELDVSVCSIRRQTIYPGRPSILAILQSTTSELN